VHLYGAGIESLSLQAPSKELIKALAKAGRNRPLQVLVKGEEKPHLTFVRELQWHGVQGNLLHVDLLQVDISRRIRAEVPLELVGDAPALKLPRTSVVQNMFAVEVEALPMSIPQRLQVDLSKLVEISSVIRAGDIALAEGVTLVSPAEAAVVTVAVAAEEVKPVAAEAAPAEGEAAEEGAEGEAKAEKTEGEPKKE
jgi:large subunit ribosomal protein L25